MNDHGHSSHGGTLIGIKNEHSSEPVRLPDEIVHNCTACTVSSTSETLLFFCCYFPPRTSPFAIDHQFLEHFFIYLESVFPLYSNVVICGDFIFDIDWRDYSSTFPDEQRFITGIE